MAVQLVGHADRVDDAARERCRARGLVDARLQDRELVAAEAGDDVRIADAAAQALGDRLQ